MNNPFAKNAEGYYDSFSAAIVMLFVLGFIKWGLLALSILASISMTYFAVYAFNWAQWYGPAKTGGGILLSLVIAIASFGGFTIAPSGSAD